MDRTEEVLTPTEYDGSVPGSPASVEEIDMKKSLPYVWWTYKWGVVVDFFGTDSTSTVNVVGKKNKDMCVLISMVISILVEVTHFCHSVDRVVVKGTQVGTSVSPDARKTKPCVSGSLTFVRSLFCLIYLSDVIIVRKSAVVKCYNHS